MSNDPTPPGVSPARGFAGILSLVSDVSVDLKAVEEAVASAPPPAPPQPPKPVRFGPSTPESSAPLFSGASGTTPSDSSGGIPWGFIVVAIILLIRIAACAAR